MEKPILCLVANREWAITNTCHSSSVEVVDARMKGPVSSQEGRKQNGRKDKLEKQDRLTDRQSGRPREEAEIMR